MTNKRKSAGINLTPYVMGITVILSLFALYIGYRVYTTEKILIPVSVLALLAGLFYEYKRISETRGIFLVTCLLAFILSFFAFIPGKHETNYILENHIELWPFIFCIFFILFAIGFAGNKIIPKLTEGITLMQSIALIYFIIDIKPVAQSFVILLKLIGLFFAAYSIYFSFNSSKISRSNRLHLSIWSSLIMIVFSVDNIYELYKNPPIEQIASLTNAAFVAAQFFLLGVSSIYIVQNYFMIFGFIPTRDRFFNDKYYKDLKKLRKNHVDRYSSQQITKVQTMLCVLISGTIYFLNYIYEFLPRNFVIWMVFVLFPIFSNIFLSDTYQSGKISDANPSDGIQKFS